MLKAKRVYEPKSSRDGTRVLVMRLWPRGIKKAHVDLWLKDLGAELANLRAYNAGRASWPEMRRRYLAGLKREPQYRYTVLGYVTDARGRPRPGVGLEVTRQKTGFAYQGETDASGLYVIVTLLADESRGERLLVRAGPASLWVTARFQPADHAAERGTRVDFAGDKVVEQAGLFQATLTRFLGR